MAPSLAVLETVRGDRDHGGMTETHSRNAPLAARDLAHVWHPCTQMREHDAQLPLIPIVRGDGAWLVDADGKRSEERRVGKECRSRWSAEHEKKKDEREGQGVRAV